MLSNAHLVKCQDVPGPPWAPQGPAKASKKGLFDLLWGPVKALGGLGAFGNSLKGVA